MTEKPLSSQDISLAPLLHARASFTCPMRIHLDVEQPVPLAPVPMPADIQARIDRGIDHEDHVVAALQTLTGPIPSFLGDPDGARKAMAEGVPLLTQVPLLDPVGRRTGRPDLLVLTGHVTPEGAPVYTPVDVKSHKVANAVDEDGDLPVLSLHQLADAGSDGVDLAALAADPRLKGRRDTRDLLTLAHYHRLLEAAGHAGEPVGGIIGSEGFLAVWRLDEPRLQSWRNVRGRWTVLQKYDHEFGFRLDVAAVAASHHSGGAHEPALVVPARISDCDTCPWEGWCTPRMDQSDELTLLPGVGWAERHRLHAAGVTTRTDLAATSPTDHPTKTLAKAVDHARLAAASIQVARRRGAGSLHLPRADVEVDVDMECTPDGRVYLWGNLVTADGSASYVPFADFSPDLDDAAVFAEFFAWLIRTRDDAVASGRTFAAYCWSPAENRFLRHYGRPAGIDVEAFIASPHWIDLEQVIKAHLITADGSTSLKAIAPLAGFAWRAADASGAMSMEWYAAAVAGDDEMRQQALHYNEDDVRAPLAIRDWLQAAWDDLPCIETIADARG